MNKNIVLIGLMGSGKTTVGKLLAAKTYRKFIDTDSLIEIETKITIGEIFKNYGEEYFRDIESAIVKKVSSCNNSVISTGGGIVERFENIQLLKENAVLVYLKASPEELYSRIKNQTDRPLLMNNKPLETLKSLLNKREKMYNQANITVNTQGKSLEKIVNEIISNVN